MIINNLAVEIEGVDKAGKDQLAVYLTMLGNYAYTLNVRGILTQLVYNDKFDRNNTYVLPYKPFVVFLDVDNTDHAIRCALSKEPKININKDREVYYKYIEELKSYGITVLTYNTTELTPYKIAQDIIDKLSKTDINNYICTEPIVFKNLKLYSMEDLKDEDVFYKFEMEEN